LLTNNSIFSRKLCFWPRVWFFPKVNILGKHFDFYPTKYWNSSRKRNDRNYTSISYIPQKCYEYNGHITHAIGHLIYVILKPVLGGKPCEHYIFQLLIQNMFTVPTTSSLRFAIFWVILENCQQKALVL